MTEVAALEAKLGHTFAAPKLLVEALTHPSAGAPNYQRLEFLGDRVLGLEVAKWLMDLYPAADEGELARRHTALVRTQTLANVADKLGLEAYIRRGPGEMAPLTASVKADVVEALTGALWLEDTAAAARFLHTVLNPQADGDARDPKTLLQERVQAQGDPRPVYTDVGRTGPDHAPTFTVRVACTLGEAEGTAGSKQEAGQKAAEALMMQHEKASSND